MRDTFLTTSYKGFYINSCYNRETQKEEINAFGIIAGVRYEKDGFKSYHAAKCWIARMISNIYSNWSYKGIDIFRADRNSSGIRWISWNNGNTLRADSKASMRELINHYSNSH